ncbi:MAG TPA: ATP-binding cassette domain-containing protein [Thermomicrobiaceae bacterium]|nr:ATP-binding cassette domain-containing protein [Thermomicrobiaceae bacterium]
MSGSGASRSVAPVAIEARGWGWRHAGRRDWALRGLDLRIEAGERVLLVGPSGAGKSTMLNAVAGLLDPHAGHAEGRLTVDGRDPRDARDTSGLVFQDPESQLVMARAGDDVAFGLENRCLPRDAIWPRVEAALSAVGFAYGPDHPTDALSGGEQQRLAIAGVVALRPGLLLLDEPTANLDPEGAALVRGVVASVVEQLGMTLLMVEHRVADAIELVDRVIAVEAGGGIVADGPPDYVFMRHGDALADAGVWVPDRRLPAPPVRARPAAETLLMADQAEFRYPGSVLPALPRTDLQVKSAEALAVVGPNGSGKSTLAFLLAGLLRPTGGSVVAGESLAPGRGHEPIAAWPAGELAGRIGTVFQDPEHQFLTSRVRDELTVGPRAAGLDHSAAVKRAEELLARLHLERLADANPFTLSGGEKRRLSVATALAAAPAVLILDEPTFGQDRRTAIELLRLLAALRDEGRAVLFVTHDREFATALADRTLRLAARGSVPA